MFAKGLMQPYCNFYCPMRFGLSYIPFLSFLYTFVSDHWLILDINVDTVIGELVSLADHKNHCHVYSKLNNTSRA